MKNVSMESSRKKPIIVTGSHRSGSTWTGRMIACSRETAYIHEPFNLYHRPGICKAKFNNWFPYICEDNESQYVADLQDCFAYKYNLREEMKAVGSAEDLARMIFDSSRFFFYRCFADKRPLIKDPIALFSLEWLVRRFDMEAVVLIRHPAAFAGSLKKIQWTHPFNHFLNQPLLMEKLQPFRQEIEEFAAEEKSIVDQSILLWNMIHYIILEYKRKHPSWIYVRHEDISREPTRSFRHIYRSLGLSYTSRVQRKIEEHSRLKKKTGKSQKLVRDSKANIKSWQNRLTSEEIVAIREGTEEIAGEFYDSESWS